MLNTIWHSPSGLAVNSVVASPFHGCGLQVEDVKVPRVLNLHGFGDTRGDVIYGQESCQLAGDMVGICEQRRRQEVHIRGGSEKIVVPWLWMNYTRRKKNRAIHIIMLSVNLRFVESMYSFPDSLRKPSCEHERKKKKSKGRRKRV